MSVSKSQLKKNLKKLEKIKIRLTNKHGIRLKDEPSDIIIIANAGLANDVKRHELELHLLPFDEQIKNIITSPQLTFAVVICNDCSSGAEIFTQLQFFTILTPDLSLRPCVNAFCLFSENLPTDIEFENVHSNSCGPPGLIILDNFIGIDEERLLVESFINLEESDANKGLKHRTVMHFGFEFNYANNLADSSKPLVHKPIPKSCCDILSRLDDRTGKKKYSAFDQLTVNIYRPGDGIPPHTDTHSAFTDEIVSISLNSDILMDWTNPDSQEMLTVDLKARSACIMTGESRYFWKHSIASRQSDLVAHSSGNGFEKRQRSLRISLTFRQLAPVPQQCRCGWARVCDTPQRDDRAQFVVDCPEQLEAQFVHSVYDNIADHFSSTRHSMWPRVRAFIERQPSAGGAIGADIGCGNGKYFPAIMARGALLGSDSSGNLCRIAAAQHRVDVVQSNCLQLPYRDGCCDYFICIAVLHHLSTADRRRAALERMVRVLRPTGQGLVYVWAQDQQIDGKPSKYLDRAVAAAATTVTTAGQLPLPVHTNRTEFSSADMLVPWSRKGSSQKNDEVYTRYYHLFQQGELEALCGSVGGVRVVESWYDSGNWAVVLEKL